MTHQFGGKFILRRAYKAVYIYIYIFQLKSNKIILIILFFLLQKKDHSSAQI